MPELGVGKARKTRVAFLNTHPIQYFAPLYAELNRADELEIVAIYLSDCSVRGAVDPGFSRVVKWDLDLLSGYESRFVAGSSWRSETGGFLSTPAVWQEIRFSNYDAVVIHGHTPFAMLVGVAAAKFYRVPVFMRCETNLAVRKSVLRRALRKPLLSLFYRLFDGFLSIGSANRDFYRAMGVPAERITSVPYAVDNARFMAATQCQSERLKIRQTLGVDDDTPIVLFAAKLQPRKRPDDLIRAAALLADRGVRIRVALLGAGEMEAELQRLVGDLGSSNVHFAGFVNQSALPSLYAACDVFVLPSEDENWGLVVNEAMCAGLPVVVSSGVGCAADLVQQGINGFTYPVKDVTALADRIGQIVLDPAARRRMGESSRLIIERWSYAECCKGLRSALESKGLMPADEERVQQTA